jgi:glucokinase
MSSYGIGVDLGGTNLRIAAVDNRGTLLEKTTLGTQVSRGRYVVLNDMVEAIRSLATKLQRSGEMAGIGIAVPGIIEMETGIVRKSPNLPDWADYPVRNEIENALGTSVILENDANAAALGEKWQGAARDFDSMAMLTLGTGVGGGLVFDGKVWHGMNGMAAELGHMNVEPDGHPCGCGSIGCLEQYASATAIVRMAREALASGVDTQLRRAAEPGRNEEFNSRIVFQLAIQGDPIAQDIFNRVGRSLGRKIGDLVNALNLHMYVIGGGVSSAWEVFAPALFEELRKRSLVYVATAPERLESPSPQGKHTIVTRALLGSDAGLYGAARLPLQQVETVSAM